MFVADVPSRSTRPVPAPAVTEATVNLRLQLGRWVLDVNLGPEEEETDEAETKPDPPTGFAAGSTLYLEAPSIDLDYSEAAHRRP